MRFGLYLFIYFIISSCSSNKYENEAWSIAENSDLNKGELIQFLETYKSNEDRDKYAAACYLIRNLPGKSSITAGNIIVNDIDVVKADSLSASLEYSFRLRENSSYLKEYSFDQFLEYILPYRIAHEPLEYYWKWDCARHFYSSSPDSIREAADHINSLIRLNLSSDFYTDLPKSYTDIIRDKYGKCDDRTILLVMALRSAGIPAAYEFVPCWGSLNIGHSFATVIMPDGSTYPLNHFDDTPEESFLFRKTPKVYRRMYSIQQNIQDREAAPDLFCNSDILDVTGDHQIGTCTYRLNNKSEGMTYLSVFSPNGWKPVAASVDGTFPHVGTGSLFNKTESAESLDLGRGILYLPSFWKNGVVLPAQNPVVISDDSICEIKADISISERVILRRKFPLNIRIVNFAKLMLYGVFEGANKKDFSDAVELFKIVNIPESKMQQVQIVSDKPYRYIRYRRPKGTFSIAEFKLYDKNGACLSFAPMLPEGMDSGTSMKNIFDSDPLTYYQINAGIGVDIWAGADLRKSISLGSIVFAPRNDDNAVAVNNRYELFYWNNNKWSSLGQTIADSDSLIYENVPKGALLWLRNLTKGREERPFTYEDGKQIWW